MSLRAAEKIVTARLVLEPTQRSHASGLWEAIESSLPELLPWMSWAVDSSPANVERFAEEAQRGWQEKSGWAFTILHEDRPVGVLGLNGYKPLLAMAELGYWISTSHTGRGLMTEAASAVVDWGFEVMGLHRIELRASPDNIDSVRVAEKIGFKHEGIARLACRGSEGWHDIILFGLLDGDERLAS